MLADRIVPQPKHFQIRQLNQVLEFAQIADQILPQVQLLQLLRVLEDFELRDVVERQRADLHVGDLR